MKYEIGDKIIVLHSDEEGKVIDIINDKMVMIEVRGVKFPAYMDQIDFPYYKMFTAKKIVEKKKIFVDDLRKEKPAPKSLVGEGVKLLFIPVFEKDVFDDDATVWPPQNIENNSLAQSGIRAIANYKSTNQSLDIPSNGITPNSAQELVNATPQATESSRPMYAWIETQATFLGYISNPFGQFIEWLDQLIANVERWIINLWQKIWGLFSNFKKNK
jgi:hypothetical protein